MTDVPRAAARALSRAWGTVVHDVAEIWANRAAARQIGRFAVSMGLRRVAEARRPAGDVEGVPDASARTSAGETAADRDRSVPVGASPGRGDAPWPDYGTLTGAQIVERMSNADADVVRAILAHESGGRRRQSVMAVAERRLADSGGEKS